MKSVVLIRTLRTPAIDRILQYADQVGWRIQTVEYTTNSINAFLIEDGCRYPDIRKHIAYFRPDGCIVDAGASPSAYVPKDFGNTPTVFLEREPDHEWKTAHCVYSDAREIAELAAFELLATGIDNFACIEWPTAVSWSVNRSREFQRIVRQQGKVACAYRLPGTASQLPVPRGLVDFLRKLPKPCGIFAINDAIARLVVNACQKAGIAIPDDCPVISVDNNEDICENSPVTLTSIKLDIASGGQLAAQLLDELMSGETGTSPCRTFGASRLVHRASAPDVTCHDIRLKRALEFIRSHAADGIGTSDVVATMGCSRSLAFRLFASEAKTTILDAIQRRRIELAKPLLRTRMHSIYIIAKLCGFEDDCDFRRVFKRYLGLTPREWASKNRTSPTEPV